MPDSSAFELVLLAAASLGIVLSSRMALRMMRSRAAVVRRSRRI